ncbi:MAG: hypothetical protein QM723_06120 [Myxococcaceae bacterium]
MRHEQSIPLPFGPEPVLDLHADATKVEVLPVARGEEPRIEIEGKGEIDGRAPLKVEQRGAVVFVRLDHEWVERWPTPMEIKKLILHVPAHVKAKLHCDMGKLRIHGLAGCDLDVEGNAGKLELDEVRGRLKLTMHMGSIYGERVGGTFDVRTDAGSVALAIDALDEGEHFMRTSMGSVKVDLARGLDVYVDGSTTLGSVRSSYPSKRDAKTVLRLESQLGSVRVREAGEPDDPRHGDWPDWRKWWADAREVIVTNVPAASEYIPPAPPEPAEPTEAQQERELSTRKILEMVQDGKLTPVEAERLIRAMR